MLPTFSSGCRKFSAAKVPLVIAGSVFVPLAVKVWIESG